MTRLTEGWAGAWVGLPAGSIWTEPGSEKLTLEAGRGEGQDWKRVCTLPAAGGGTPGFHSPWEWQVSGQLPACLLLKPDPVLTLLCYLPPMRGHSGPHAVA